MEQNEWALVLEGGGMRGAFTAGVLDLFLERKVYFPYAIGVSAGASNGISYASRQQGRSFQVMYFILVAVRKPICLSI